MNRLQIWSTRRRLRSADVEERLRAVSALKASGGAASVKALLRAVTDSSQPATVRRAATDALKMLRDPRALEPLLAVVGGEPGAPLRDALMRAVKAVAGPASVPTLVSVVMDSNQPVVARQAAGEALAAVRDPRCVTPLRSLVQTTDGALQLKIIAALDATDPAWLATPEGRPFRVQREQITARAVAEAQARRQASPPDAYLLLNDPRPSVRARGATVLGEIGDARAQTALEAALKDSAKSVRNAADRALAHIAGSPSPSVDGVRGGGAVE
jgi:HEAT repeat protein